MENISPAKPQIPEQAMMMIYAALLISVLFYLGTGLFLSSNSAFPWQQGIETVDRQFMLIIVMAFFAIAIVDFAIGFYLFKMVRSQVKIIIFFKKFKESGMDYAAAIIAYNQKLFAFNLIVWVIFDSIGMMGLICYAITGYESALYGMSVMGLAAFALSYPKPVENELLYNAAIAVGFPDATPNLTR
jgi:hypothetical protein